ncbi:urea amidolyase associated protein UAAP1 [Dermatobacter hominis]|uniref:urea amidolyase associated protein UAAP1 n=1 Tax=Dermatobacter hominis TaxID=2884263 RepID=UPI0035AC04DE
MGTTRVRTQPTVPAGDASDLPEGVEPADVVWAEVLDGGGATAKVLARGTHLMVEDTDGDGCVGLLVHRADQTAERLNIADTVKVQWQAYPTAGSLLLSDLGRVMMAVVEDTSGRHDAFCGTSNRSTNERRYGDGEVDGPNPNGRDRFAVALIKQGLDRRDVAPNLTLFKGVTVADDGTIALDAVPAAPGTRVVLRAEMDVLVTLVDVPHVLDDRPDYTVTPVRILAWRGEPAAPDDPVRNATPEGLRAYLNTEDLYAAAAPAAGSGRTAS